MRTLFIFLFSLVTIPLFSQASLSLVPQPQELNMMSGTYELPRETAYFLDPAFSKDCIKTFGQALLRNDYDLKRVKTADQANLVILKSNNISSLEGYTLYITANGILISAQDEAGAFYALQTLRQLFGQGFESGYMSNRQLPLVAITDEPSFRYRGVHLDVGRHYFPVPFIKKYIDLLAYHKFNKFHWHLTEDQGWRIEIKKYPKLTEVGAYRKETLIGKMSDDEDYDNTRYGGYYTQEEVKDIVAYAKDRMITIIPEIELPGHSQAALAAYPWLGCTGGPYEVRTRWGVSENVYCPTDSTFAFLEDVLTEVMALFPSTYIHIGGDECPKESWKNSAFCQQLIKKENLKDEHELQSYFIQRIERFLNKHGRSIIGWDEILEGGLAPNATVMSWRGEAGGIAAAKQKHDVIMTPGHACYFDHYQGKLDSEPMAIGGFTPLKNVYNYEVIPKELTAEEAKYVLGAQANLWTEYIRTPEHAEYMLFPRACALAEVLWTNPSTKDYKQFEGRLNEHLHRLDDLNVNYAKSHFELHPIVSTAQKEPIVRFENSYPNAIIKYRTDGRIPSNRDPELNDTLVMRKSMDFVAAQFREGYQIGEIFRLPFIQHLGLKADITFDSLPSPQYQKGGLRSIVNGLEADLDDYQVPEWLGWNNGKGFTLTMTLDEDDVHELSTRFIHYPGSWIHRPTSVEVFVSDGNGNFDKVNNIELENLQNNLVLTSKWQQDHVRVVKLMVKTKAAIPKGYPGAGYRPWVFLDEVFLR